MQLFPYQEHGLQDIWLFNGYTTLTNEDREKIVTIKNQPGLRVAIGIYLCQEKKILHGKDLKFLRHQLRMTQVELARLTGDHVRNSKRYEKGDTEIPGSYDRLVRLLYLEHVNETFLIKEVLSNLADLDSKISYKQVFCIDKDGTWETV